MAFRRGLRRVSEGSSVPDGRTFPPLAGFSLVSIEETAADARVPVRVVHPDPGLTVAFAPSQRTADDWYQFELQFPPEGVVEVLAHIAFADGGAVWQRMPALARNHFLAQFRLHGTIERLTLTITGSGRLAEPARLRFARVGWAGHLAAVGQRGVEIVRRDGLRAVWSALNYLWRLTRPGSIVISRGSASAAGEDLYDTWVRVFDEAPECDSARHAERLASLTARPLISVLAFGGATAGEQIYPDVEVLTAPPGAEAAGVLNGLLAKARGVFVLPLAQGTTLRPHALLDLALVLQQHPEAELVYSDEDRIQNGRRLDPRFKPAWSPDVLRAHDYIDALTLLRAATVRSVGGWRAEAGSACRHDLLLRLAARVAPETIVHVAKVLVHTAEATEPPLARPHYAVPMPPPRVSLIIPTRDSAALLETCISSIRRHTRYPDYEILIIDNGSVEDTTKALFARLTADPAIRVLPRPGPFNFSALNNSAVGEATGSIVGLVNNDIEATEDGWLDEMVALAARPDAGCVGARLLYPDGRLQHGGIVIGIGGVAGHAHRFAPPSAPGYLNRLRTVQNMSAVTAACLLVRKSVYDQVSGLDEGLTVAFNDVDFCLRVRAAGYLNLWTPFATLTHHESASRGRDMTPAKARRFADEYAAMQKRWGADLLADPYYSPNLSYDREDFSVRPR
jgi:GT2 family glycosyltransferase